MRALEAENHLLLFLTFFFNLLALGEDFCFLILLLSWSGGANTTGCDAKKPGSPDMPQVSRWTRAENSNLQGAALCATAYAEAPLDAGGLALASKFT